MKNFGSHLLTALMGAVIVFVLMKQCNTQVNIADVEYIKGDSVPYTVYKDRPVPYKITYRDTIRQYDTTILDADTVLVSVPVDTSFILRDYFAKVDYVDTLRNDSSALIILSQTLSENRVKDLRVDFQNRRPIAIIQKRKRAFVFGFTAFPGLNDVSIGFRSDRNVFSLVHNGNQFGIRYQRELGFGK